MARPKRQDERRAHLKAAARAAIIAHGLANVRVRDIADAADMSPGTITYYFREIDDLFQDVYDEAVERFFLRRSEACLAYQDPADKLRALIDSGLPSGPDDELCCLLYEFSPQARRQKNEASLRRNLYDRQVDLYQSIFRDGVRSGAFTLTVAAPHAARNLVALEDAYGYHVIVGTSVSRAMAHRLLHEYATAVTGVASKPLRRNRSTVGR